MSKRKSQTSITAYREEGYLPEAFVNFIAFLGWSPGTEEEIFSLDELAGRSSCRRSTRAAPSSTATASTTSTASTSAP